MKTHSAIELFVILVQLPNKSVKIDFFFFFKLRQKLYRDNGELREI